ncbi:hypothetical protein BDP27DRAFT_1420851 [Rhodocollybia butyracea]|uniref:Uncharacterized protein n=1 Tax=Rhodocollybia butyracea TaxID=206335 RepID=A0A9P5PUG3_9AGAR|nr:hypothetical protein BDP27DRAFT_1420851 [Rhodocollybia butyracea]
MSIPTNSGDATNERYIPKVRLEWPHAGGWHYVKTIQPPAEFTGARKTKGIEKLPAMDARDHQLRISEPAMRRLSKSNGNI